MVYVPYLLIIHHILKKYYLMIYWIIIIIIIIIKQSPFSEELLLVGLYYDRNRIEILIRKTIKQTLKPPIQESKYHWFIHYLFQSSLWFFTTSDNKKYFYEILLEISIESSKNIENEWIISIIIYMKVINKNIIIRQDNNKINI